MKNHWLDQDLHIYSNWHEFVIATSIEEAKNIIVESYGYEFEKEDIEGDGWRQYPDDIEFDLYNEDQTVGITKLASEWIKEHGKGHFASREF